jgi:hypothetical protein
MSLLAQVNQPNANRFYFALDTSPTDPTVTAPAFEATGTATSNGSFTALGTAVPGGIGMFNMETTLGRAQWAIGMDAVPAGGNSGDNFALFSYDDNGAFLSAPLQVIRATGGVITQNGLTTTTLAATGAVTADSLIVGDGTEAGGALAQINGTAGLSRVFDGVYNRPLPGAEVVLSTFNNVGAAIALVPYTPTNSGLFTLTMEVRTDTTGYAWANGTDIISGYLANVAPPFALLSDSFTTCDSLANPAGFFYPSGFPPGVCVKDIVAVINLTAGVAYQPTISINGAFNLGTTGGVRFFIQPMLA